MNDSIRPGSAPRSPGDDGSQASDREEWIHDFRNALGNITIAASAASGQFSSQQDPLLRAMLVQIEEGCERCLKLLRTMPP